MLQVLRASMLIIGLFLSAQAAWAEAYDDFSKGVSAYVRGNCDSAIAAFTRALDAPDLNPSLRPVAYLDRARCFANIKQWDKAMADAASALSLKPETAEAYRLRSFVLMGQGKTDAAVAELDKGMAAVPTDAAIAFERGLLKWELAKFENAAADFALSLKLNPSHGYTLLFYVISKYRASSLNQDELARLAEHIDLREWPGPIVKFFQSRRSEEDAMKAASSGTSYAEAGQKCEAQFYIGEWYLMRGELAAAKPLLQDASTACPPNFIEYHAAKVEMGRTAFP